jgi:hypothetical protein
MYRARQRKVHSKPRPGCKRGPQVRGECLVVGIALHSRGRTLCKCYHSAILVLHIRALLVASNTTHDLSKMMLSFEDGLLALINATHSTRTLKHMAHTASGWSSTLFHVPKPSENRAKRPKAVCGIPTAYAHPFVYLPRALTVSLNEINFNFVWRCVCVCVFVFVL